jgi:hypothetical protein
MIPHPITSICFCGLKYQYYPYEKMDRCISCQDDERRKGNKLIGLHISERQRQSASKKKYDKFYYTAHLDHINAKRRELRVEKKIKLEAG